MSELAAADAQKELDGHLEQASVLKDTISDLKRSLGRAQEMEGVMNLDYLKSVVLQYVLRVTDSRFTVLCTLWACSMWGDLFLPPLAIRTLCTPSLPRRSSLPYLSLPSLYRYISTTDVNQHKTLLAVLAQLLKLSPEEVANVRQTLDKVEASSGIVGGITSWLSPYS